MLAEAVKDHASDGWPLVTTAKRYWLPELIPNERHPDALTLIFLHATSFHKETWEPCLEKLLTLSAMRDSKVRIREAWSLDCPNHGEAGHLNEPLLHEPAFRNNFTCEKYAQAVHRFISDAPYHSAGIDFRARNLVGIGHSLGGNAMLLLQRLKPHIQFKSLIVVEPLISPAGPTHLNKLRSILVHGAHERRDVWPDRRQAMVALKRRARTARWDPRILDLFVKHAIVPHPGSYESETPYRGVTLACSRDQEAAMYRDAEGPIKPVEALKKICRVIPIHVILAGVNDFIPERVHKAIEDPNHGCIFASSHKVPAVGHLIPQEAPDQLGNIIYEILCGKFSASPSKLQFKL